MRIFLLLSILLFNFSKKLGAQSTVDTSLVMPVRSVIVHPHAAHITRSDTFELEAGTLRLVLRKLETSLFVETVQIGLAEGLTLTGYRTGIDHDPIALPPAFFNIPISRDSLRSLQDSITAERAGLLAALEVLTANQKVSSEQDQNVNQSIAERAATYAHQVQALEKKRLATDRFLTSAERELLTLKNREESMLSKKSDPLGYVALEIEVDEAGRYPISLMYLTGDAGWQQEHDIYIDSVTATRVLSAKVFQSTTTPWDSVSMMLSTGDPQQASSLEELVARQTNPLTKLGDVGLRKMETSADVVGIRGGRTNASQYVIDGVRFTGEVPPEQGFWVTSRRMRPATLVQTAIPVAVQSRTLASTTYQLPGVQSLASKSGKLTLKLNKRQFPLAFRYRANPALSNVAFLEARFGIAEERDLLNKTLRLHHGGKFVGSAKSFRKVGVDSVSIGLGPEERLRILIEATPPKNQRWSLFRFTPKTSVSYTLTTENLLPSKAHVVIEAPVGSTNFRNRKVKSLLVNGEATTAKSGAAIIQASIESGAVQSYSVSYDLGR